MTETTDIRPLCRDPYEQMTTAAGGLSSLLEAARPLAPAEQLYVAPTPSWEG